MEEDHDLVNIEDMLEIADTETNVEDLGDLPLDEGTLAALEADLDEAGLQAEDGGPEEGEANTDEQGEAPGNEEIAAAEEQPASKKTANDRIQELVSERNEARQMLQAQQAQQAQAQQAWQQQQQAQMHQMQQQMQQSQQQFQAQLQEQRQQSQRAADREEEENLSPWDKEMRARDRYADEVADRKASEAVANVRQELDQMKAAETQRQAEAENYAKKVAYDQGLNELDRQATAAVNEFLSQYPEDRREGLREATTDMLMSFCLTDGKQPMEALPGFRKYTQSLAGLETARTTQSTRETIKRNKTLPRAPGGTRGSTKPPSKWPSMQELHANGMESHVQWVSRGSPNLSS